MSYHFIGLGGIGMSALARILLQNGRKVQGSDLKASSILQKLEQEGAKVVIGHTAESIEGAETIVYSTDIKESNIEFRTAQERKLPLLHRSDLLHELMKGKKNLLVTGTHGKTTTTALLASVLMEACLDPSFVVGGWLRSLNTNGRAGAGEYFVAEADESDGSFLKTAAYAAIVTNLENDHLDYWGSPRMLDLAFDQFMGQTERLFWCADDPRLSALKPKGASYGFCEGADWQISGFRPTPHGIVFDLGAYTGIEASLFGRHNALNAAAVFALALSLEIPEEAIRCALKKFSGTARRMEWKGEKRKVELFDDYGHHPTEIRAALKALREKIKERRLIAVFQPHRYTRVRDLFHEFADCFEEADAVMMTDIYSAGEPPIPGITSASLYTFLRDKLGGKIHFFPRTHLESGVAAFLKPLDVVVTLGAGDVTAAGIPILDLYEARAPKWTVGVLFGGRSAEHPVSLMSAQNLIQALDSSIYQVQLFGITKEGKWHLGFDPEAPSFASRITPEILQELVKCDVCLPVLHGPQGEDGMIAAFLETLGIAYVGCDYRSGAVCMHKAWTKQIVMNHGVPVVPFFEVDQTTYRRDPGSILQKIEERFPYPVWIKPVHLGSSIGVARAACSEEVFEAIELALSYDDAVIVEKQIVGREIEFSILGNQSIQTALPAEIVSSGEFVAYHKKYGSDAMEIRVPARITEVQKQIGCELAEKAYRACGCMGLARVDFFLDRQGRYWFNEINPFPGFTDTSAYPKAWDAAGLGLEALVDEMVACAFHRARMRGQK